MEYLNSGISEEETLQVALQSGIIDINEISMRIEDMKRKEILSNHPYSIWYSETDNLWKTYLPDIENKNGRIFRKRKNKKDLVQPYYFVKFDNHATGYRGLRTDRYTYAVHATDGKIDNVILFDRTNDPHEMNNIASQQLKLTHTFNRQLKTWLEKTNDPFAQYIKLK